jgi:glycosyltransferase 2 family protein
MRKFIVAFGIMLGVIFVQTRLAEVSSIYATLKQADWRYIALAVLLLGGWYLSTAGSYWSIYRTMGMEQKLGTMLIIFASAYYANVVTPAGAVGVLAVFISEGKRIGISSARITVANAVQVLFEYLGFLVVLVLGLIVLFRRQIISPTEMTASAILLLFIVLIGSMLLIGMRSPEQLGKVLAAGARRINRILWVFLHRPYLSPEKAIEFAHDAAGGLHRLRYQPNGLLVPALLTFTGRLILLLIFLLSFLAFAIPSTPGTIIAGFSLVYLFSIVSPTPNGLGFVEGLAPLALASMYVPLGAATLIILAYRGITFWLPLLIGFIAFNWLMPKQKAAVLPVE